LGIFGEIFQKQGKSSKFSFVICKIFDLFLNVVLKKSVASIWHCLWHNGVKIIWPTTALLLGKQMMGSQGSFCAKDFLVVHETSQPYHTGPLKMGKIAINLCTL